MYHSQLKITIPKSPYMAIINDKYTNNNSEEKEMNMIGFLDIINTKYEKNEEYLSTINEFIVNNDNNNITWSINKQSRNMINQNVNIEYSHTIYSIIKGLIIESNMSRNILWKTIEMKIINEANKNENKHEHEKSEQNNNNILTDKYKSLELPTNISRSAERALNVIHKLKKNKIGNIKNEIKQFNEFNQINRVKLNNYKSLEAKIEKVNNIYVSTTNQKKRLVGDFVSILYYNMHNNMKNHVFITLHTFS
jgi:hypothetical protein